MDDQSLTDMIIRFNRLTKSLDGVYTAASGHFGMAEHTFWVLYTLTLEGRPMSQKELCAAMFSPKQSINSALKKLEADGCVRLEFAENSRKTKLIHLTEKGAALAEDTAMCMIDIEKRVLSRMDSGHMAKMLDYYEEYTEILREETGQF